jgi:hypothetical protein
MTKIIMKPKKRDTIIISLFLFFMWIGTFSLFFIHNDSCCQADNPLVVGSIFSLLAVVFTFIIFHGYWMTVEADLYKITIQKIWGETVLFYQDCIIETLTTHDRYKREFYFMKFVCFENNKTYLIPSTLINFKDFTIFLLKNNKITGDT